MLNLFTNTLVHSNTQWMVTGIAIIYIVGIFRVTKFNKFVDLILPPQQLVL